MIKFLFILMALQVINIHGFEIQPRIVNGHLSNPQDFPFYVHLRITKLKDGVPISISGCGGSLLSDRWIVTAAHCLLNASEAHAHIGTDANGDFYDIAQIPSENHYIHEKYDDETSVNDIGLLHLPQPIVRSPLVQPAKLSTDCAPLDNENVIAAGCGQQSFDHGSELDTKIRHAYLRAINSTFCAVDKDPESVICTIPVNGQSPYSGDSGGPLVRQNDGTVIGVASLAFQKTKTEGFIFKVKTSTSHMQSFARIQHYFEWIEGITGLELPQCSD